MADRKIASLKKKLAPRKPKPTKAPGKPDPKFLDRLSKALRDELDVAEPPDIKAAPAKRVRSPADQEPRSPGADRPSERKPGKTAPVRSGTAEAAVAPASRPDAKSSIIGKNRRAALLKELRSILEELDEEGLDFLLEQAHIHRYNMEVERLNEAEVRREASRSEDAGDLPVKRSASSAKPSARSPVFRIERSRDGQTYHVVSGGRYKMFSAEEMLALVRIAHANPADAEAGRGLHRWMSRERTDALADLGFAGPSDPALAALAALLRSSFAAPPKRS